MGHKELIKTVWELDTKLRSKYRSLKIRIILQTLGISLIVACIGYFVLDIFVDGVFQDPFAKTVVYIFERIGMDELEAIRVYRLIFVQIKQ